LEILQVVRVLDRHIDNRNREGSCPRACVSPQRRKGREGKQPGEEMEASD
jgi:hypothetical protein